MRPGSAAVFLIFLMNVSTGQTPTCYRDEYETSGGCCPMCPAGRWVYEDCTESRSSLCKACPGETFMNHPTSRKECYKCKSCDEGSGLKNKTSCTNMSDTVCEPLEGFYCSDSREDDCEEARKHRRCKPGEYIREHGTSSADTMCSTCSDGTFSDRTFTSCQNHTQCESEGLLLLRAGTETEDAQCGGKVSYRTEVTVAGVAGVVIVLVVCYLVCRKIQQKKSRKIKHSGPSYLEGVNSGQSSQQNLKSNDSKHSKIEMGQI
ncbi:tumor necrosis factor receptor superfamily member 14-like isoform X2 [Labrus mixtus]|uniref:tumor necrosis factor receptor superfamily member 14-like isoform X2 n=1 Tax=Labrus mixtus TaxID=508554 RepID=UPI0029C01D45|nr:tumor necrosis factor receptor superfamily member 14-like isoform X2 [Labrus mixtus]